MRVDHRILFGAALLLAVGLFWVIAQLLSLPLFLAGSRRARSEEIAG